MDRAFVSESVMWYVDVGADLNDTHTLNDNTPVTQTLLTCPSEFFFADERSVSQTPRTPTLPGSCHSRSARSGASPPVQEIDSQCLAGSTKEAAKAVAHTTNNIRVHRRSQARDTDLRMKLGTSCALETESCLKKSAASSLHRPPVSMSTQRRRRLPRHVAVLPHVPGHCAM